MPILKYGADSSVRLEFANGVQPDQCGSPRGEPLADLGAAISAAMNQPLDYPALRQCTTPGDRVVVALDHGLPQMPQVTASIVNALIEAGIDPDGLSILRTEADVDAAPEDPRALLPEGLVERIRVLTHDPANRRGLAYLAATEDGEPLLLNRLLTDADFVLPVGCVRNPSVRGYYGIHSGLFPVFSDHRTQGRFRHAQWTGNGHHGRGLEDEVRHVAWLLGINFTVQLVPAAGEGVLHVVAGQSDAVERRSRELYETAWACPVPHRASLVVATIEGSQRQQTWENLGRTLEAASRLVEEGGAIAVCCDLAARPGPAVQRLADARSRDKVIRQIHRDSPDDALPAAQLADALDHDHIYLLSRLDPELVEGLEMIPIQGPAELLRLTEHHKSCILLANAPHAVVTVQDDE